MELIKALFISFLLSFTCDFREGKAEGGMKAVFRCIKKKVAKIYVINHSSCPLGTAQGVMALNCSNGDLL